MTLYERVSPVLGDGYENEFAFFDRYIREANNVTLDAEAFIQSEYALELSKMLRRRFMYENDPMGEACLEYYRALGVKKELLEPENYFTRWAVFTPLDMRPDKKYPLVISFHGRSNPIEVDCFSMPFPELAGSEQFISVVPQDTTPAKTKKIIQTVLSRYPVDPERIYLSGYSQGGQQVNAALYRMPELIAAAAPGGCDIRRIYDTLMVPFTDEEEAAFSAAEIPVMYFAGACESSSFVPLNKYTPAAPRPKSLDKKEEHEPNPLRNELLDPACSKNGILAPKYSAHPPEGVNPGVWKLGELNMRLCEAGCPERDICKCLGYLDNPDSEIHHVLGFYGDAEETVLYYGYKHYIITVNAPDGTPRFKYMTVENSMHWPPVMMAQKAWEFMRQFKKDPNTGKSVFSPYVP